MHVHLRAYSKLREAKLGKAWWCHGVTMSSDKVDPWGHYTVLGISATTFIYGCIR